MNKADVGARGELAAARFLREKGYRVLTANYRCRMGEIDIVAADEKYICFVEVKARGENSLFSPADAVDFSKQKKLIAAAKLYLSQNPSPLQPRFDVLEVFCKNGAIENLHYIKNAYDGGR